MVTTCISAPVIHLKDDLISSASDICNLSGICGYLGKINKENLESLRTSASMVRTPRISQIVSPLGASAAHNLSDTAWIAEEQRFAEIRKCSQRFTKILWDFQSFNEVR